MDEELLGWRYDNAIMTDELDAAQWVLEDRCRSCGGRRLKKEVSPMFGEFSTLLKWEHAGLCPIKILYNVSSDFVLVEVDAPKNIATFRSMSERRDLTTYVGTIHANELINELLRVKHEN